MLHHKSSLKLPDSIVDIQFTSESYDFFIFTSPAENHPIRPTHLYCCSLLDRPLEIRRDIELKKERASLQSFSISSSGQHLLTGDNLWFVTLWPIWESGEVKEATTWQYDGLGLIPKCTVKSLPGGKLFIKSDTRPEYWSQETFTYKSYFHSKTLAQIWFSQDGSWMTGIDEKSHLLAWEIPDNKPSLNIDLRKFDYPRHNKLGFNYCHATQSVIFVSNDEFYSCPINTDECKAISPWPDADKDSVIVDWKTGVVAWLKGSKVYRKTLCHQEILPLESLEVDADNLKGLAWLDSKASVLALIAQETLVELDWQTGEVKLLPFMMKGSFSQVKLSYDYRSIVIASDNNLAIFDIDT